MITIFDILAFVEIYKFENWHYLQFSNNFISQHVELVRLLEINFQEFFGVIGFEKWHRGPYMINGTQGQYFPKTFAKISL